MMRLIAIGAFAGAMLTAVPARADVTAILDPYLRIHASLTKDKVETIKTDAAAIATAATALGPDAARLQAAAKTLESAPDLKAARAAFGPLTDALLAYAEKAKVTLPADVKVAYCPMAKASWLQKEAQIANPYYGTEMLSCGDFKKK